MTFLQTIHGELRWLVALVALIAIVKFALGWVRDEEYSSLDRGLMTAFTVTLDINLLLGLILLFGLPGGFPMFRIEHATTMILAVVVGHASAAWRKSPDDEKKFRNNLAVIAVALTLVIVGVIRLRGNWAFDSSGLVSVIFSTGMLLVVSFGWFAFWLWMLIECVVKEPSEGNDKIAWILLILFVPVLGAILYFFVRRPKRKRLIGE